MRDESVDRGAVGAVTWNAEAPQLVNNETKQHITASPASAACAKQQRGRSLCMDILFINATTK